MTIKEITDREWEENVYRYENERSKAGTEQEQEQENLDE
jgi:hypothetical protein